MSLFCVLWCLGRFPNPSQDLFPGHSLEGKVLFVDFRFVKNSKTLERVQRDLLKLENFLTIHEFLSFVWWCSLQQLHIFKVGAPRFGHIRTILVFLRHQNGPCISVQSG